MIYGKFKFRDCEIFKWLAFRYKQRVKRLNQKRNRNAFSFCENNIYIFLLMNNIIFLINVILYALTYYIHIWKIVYWTSKIKKSRWNLNLVEKFIEFNIVFIWLTTNNLMFWHVNFTRCITKMVYIF